MGFFSIFSGRSPAMLRNSGAIGSRLLLNFRSEKNPLVTGLSDRLQQQQRGMASKKHKAVLRMSKGYRGRANSCYRIAINRVEKAMQYAYRDRKQKKRDFKKLWIQRISAGVRQHDLSYSSFTDKLRKSNVELNRKVLAEIASHEPFSFKAVVDVLKMNAARSS
eukprot:CAMPEP_0195511896 /NCGR_PEP_ID=MMETSP0794_2-20130614/4056_1 /TAXON_ID=515487 /ORGANISM="Stephanopyxis turris, Strain CCMP 815" /LENGTH=163 /DNA_ID=CAMNT_0040639579 /DNA_START=49 /DNA_END=540 /DNA_ORIENTATION=+